MTDTEDTVGDDDMVVMMGDNTALIMIMILK